MNTLLLQAVSFLVSVFVFQLAARAADTNPPPRLTVELRDGSRVVGQSVEKSFKFHSALLGEIKLAVSNIRAVEFVSTNSTKLTTTGGDSLTVSFVYSEFAVKTSFGKVELPVASVRKFTVSATGRFNPRHEGLVALWSGDGNALDCIGGNNGTLMNGASFDAGENGEAFLFATPSAGVKVPASPGLNVGGGPGFTVECWINPFDLSRRGEIVEWNNGSINDTVAWPGRGARCSPPTQRWI
jgi:hypothetical protein